MSKVDGRYKRIDELPPAQAIDVNDGSLTGIYNEGKNEEVKTTLLQLKQYIGSDNTTSTNIPYKSTGGTFEDAPIRFDTVNNKIIFDVTAEIPPGTLQVGEGLDFSAGGVVPIFRSRLTGIQYTPNLSSYNDTGSSDPFFFDFQAEEELVLQPDFSTSIPLIGTFSNSITQTGFLNSLGIKTNANSTLTGVRFKFTSQSTGDAIFYYPSKIGWESNKGNDLTADSKGDIKIDITESPIGVLVSETIINEYKIDTGVLLGNQSNIPYQKFDRQIATATNIATEQWVIDNGSAFDLSEHSVTELNDVTSAGSGQIITTAERSKLNNLIPVGEPIVITSNLVITIANYETYNNVIVEGKKTGDTLVVDLPVISSLPSERVIFSFTNKSPDNKSMDIRAGLNDNINGAFFQRLKVGETIAIEKPSAGTSWLIVSEVIDRKPCYIEDDKPVAIPVDCNNIFVKYTDFASGGEIEQPLPALNTVGSNIRLYFQNSDSDKTHSVRFTPNGAETVNGEAEFEIAGNIEMCELVSDVENDNWILANLHFDASATSSDLELDDGTTNISDVTKITYGNARISGTSDDVTLKTINPYLNLPPLQQDTEGSTVTVLDPLQVYADPNVTDGVRIEIKRGEFELKHAPSYYATSSEELEITGLTTAGVRTAKLWFDNEVKPKGAFIDIDRTNKKIGLQEDDTLDPNITGGTAYLIFYRTAFKGLAGSDGYIEISLQDPVSGDYLEDANGNLIAVRKSYKTDDKLGALELTAIKKFLGIEYFQMVVTENFANEELVIEDRTEGNSCIMIQALDTKDQTSRALLQMENDTGINLEWTSHYLGESTFNVEYFLKEEKPLTTITSDSGETGADGWHFYNWKQMKVGVESNNLLLEDDGTNLVGFSFGKVINAEKTQLLRGKSLDLSITLKTPNSAVNVYGAKWTGVPEEYTKAIVSGMVNDVPTTETNWTLLPNPIFCIEDATGNPNTRAGTFTVPNDAENFAILILPIEEVQPFNVSVSEFKADTNPAFNGYFVHAPEIDGEKHLVEDDEYFECGLNNESYYSLRYTLSNTDTSMPAGKFIKGKADITANWANLGTAVDFLTFNTTGEASINTSVIVYTGESVPAGGESNISFWWTKETAPDVWTKIPESERAFVAKKSVTTKTKVSLPEFKFKVDAIGDKIRLYAKADILDGAYIESLSPNDYLCKTTINFKEFIPGGADAPVTDIYIYDALNNPWILTIDTEGRLSTEEVL